MTSVPISKFKARCLAMIEAVHKTGVPLRVTRFGKPLADIVPASVSVAPDWIGKMRGSGEILGDIVAPVAPEADWDVLVGPAPRPRRGRARRT
jgi:prevent-host-death family protein